MFQNLRRVKNPLICEECQNSVINFTDLIFLIKSSKNEEVVPLVELSMSALNTICSEKSNTLNTNPEHVPVETSNDVNCLDIKVKSEPEDEININIQDLYSENNTNANLFNMKIKTEPFDDLDISTEGIQVEPDTGFTNSYNVQVKTEPNDDSDIQHSSKDISNVTSFTDIIIKEEPMNDIDSFEYSDIRIKQEITEDNKNNINGYSGTDNDLQYANFKIKEESETNLTEYSETGVNNVELEIKSEPTNK